VRPVRRGLVLIAAAAAIAAFWAPTAQAFECGTTLDDFNRGNSTNLGSSWTEIVADPQISAAQFTNPGATLGLATYNGATASEACADVFPSLTGTSYAAIVLRYTSTTNAVYVKLQDNGAPFTGFDTIYFYNGNTTNLVHTEALSPVITATRFHLSVVGSTVTAEIDTNFDNQPEKVIIQQNFPPSSGTKIGLGAYGGGKIDNFSIPKTAVPPGNSALRCNGQAATRVGSDSGDIINGTNGADVIVSLGGGDIVRGRGGKDIICGGNGADKLVGGPGKDRLFGQKGKDQLVGGPKNDVCAGGPGKDTSVAC
jgi:Ca2+-binding RTX toxin-like protein